MANLNFSMYGLDPNERLKRFNNGNVVPIGTVCYKSGDFIDSTQKVIVTKENQYLCYGIADTI